MVSIFAKLAKRIKTPFNELATSNIKLHTMHVLFISYVPKIKIFEMFSKRFPICFSQLIMQSEYNITLNNTQFSAIYISRDLPPFMC